MCSKYSCYNLYLFPGDGDNSVSRNSNLKYIFFSSRSRRSFIIPKNTFILISKAFCCWLNKSKLTNFKCIVMIWVTREIFRNECSEMKHMEMMPVCEQKKKIYRYICSRFICRDFILENNTHYHLHPTPSPQLKLGVWNCMICRFRTILHEVNQIHPKTFAYYHDSFLSQGDYVNKLQHAMIEI